MDLTGFDEKQRRGLVARAGQGAVLNAAGPIESQSVRQFRGTPAYEATASMRFPNTKLKAITVERPTHLLMIMMIGPPDKIKDHEALLDQLLEIEEAEGR